MKTTLIHSLTRSPIQTTWIRCQLLPLGAGLSQVDHSITPQIVINSLVGWLLTRIISEPKQAVDCHEYNPSTTPEGGEEYGLGYGIEKRFTESGKRQTNPSEQGTSQQYMEVKVEQES